MMVCFSSLDDIIVLRFVKRWVVLIYGDEYLYSLSNPRSQHDPITSLRISLAFVRKLLDDINLLWALQNLYWSFLFLQYHYGNLGLQCFFHLFNERCNVIYGFPFFLCTGLVVALVYYNGSVLLHELFDKKKLFGEL